MDTIRRHQVALKGVVSTVVVTTLVLEGTRCICLPLPCPRSVKMLCFAPGVGAARGCVLQQ